VSQLACNAAEHAGTAMVVTVGRHAAGLRLSVRDSNPRLPYLRPWDPALRESATTTGAKDYRRRGGHRVGRHAHPGR
jgi:hypothetical protein